MSTFAASTASPRPLPSTDQDAEAAGLGVLRPPPLNQSNVEPDVRLEQTPSHLILGDIVTPYAPPASGLLPPSELLTPSRPEWALLGPSTPPIAVPGAADLPPISMPASPELARSPQSAGGASWRVGDMIGAPGEAVRPGTYLPQQPQREVPLVVRQWAPELRSGAAVAVHAEVFPETPTQSLNLQTLNPKP